MQDTIDSFMEFLKEKSGPITRTDRFRGLRDSISSEITDLEVSIMASTLALDLVKEVNPKTKREFISMYVYRYKVEKAFIERELNED